ncbi:adenosine receptor A2a-like [Oculina patagonica]
MNSTAKPNGPPDEVKIISISAKTILLVATIFGNSLVFKAFHKFPSLRTASNCILVSLSVADILTVMPFIFHITFIIFRLGEATDPSSFQFLCKSSARFSLVLVAVIILHLALISVERVIAVRFALRYHMIVTNRRAVIACLIAWLWAVAVTLLFPLALRADSERSYERLYQALHPCFQFRERERARNREAFRTSRPKMAPVTRGYFIFLVISLLVIPILTIICSYGYVFFVARKHRRQIRDQDDSQGTSTIKNELKGALTLAIVVGVCLLSFFPLLVVTSFRFFGAPRVIRRSFLKYVAYDFALGLNACLNPLIYGWRLEKFKNAFRELLKCA